MTLRPYQHGDYESITDCVEPIAYEGNFDVIEGCGAYVTAVDGNVVLGCGGVVITDDDEGEVWVRLSKRVCHKPLQLLRILKGGFEGIKACEIKTLRAKVQDGFEQGTRLAKKFGFSPTGEEITINGILYRIYNYG